MPQSLDHQTAQFPPGTMLDDKYRISKLLAVGGMGAVYVGEHTKLHKKVAIKVLRTELAGRHEVVERFQREAIAASQIGHDNIVQVTDLGLTFGGVSFLVMEYLSGESLAERIKKAGALPLAQACDICTEILSAVDAAHAAGIVHRDLKPENVFLAQRAGRGEVVKVVIDGLFFQLDGGTGSFTVQMWVQAVPSWTTITMFADWGSDPDPDGGVNLSIDSGGTFYASALWGDGEFLDTSFAWPSDGGKWHFVRVVRNSAANTFRVCVDGQLKAGATLAGGIDMSPVTVPYLGRNVDYNPPYFIGGLDDVRVFARALPCPY